jgi:hypothetical protein
MNQEDERFWYIAGAIMVILVACFLYFSYHSRGNSAGITKAGKKGSVHHKNGSM